jgi:hypothetical protein
MCAAHAAGTGLLTFGVSRNYLYRYEELVAFSLLGALAGLLGALFVYLNTRIAVWRRDRLGTNLKLRFLEVRLLRKRQAREREREREKEVNRGRERVHLQQVLIIVAITSCVTFIVPLAFGCRFVSSSAKNIPSFCASVFEEILLTVRSSNREIRMNNNTCDIVSVGFPPRGYCPEV